ncbi:glutamate--tRNA ligase [Poseidonibacter lekithochrous]|uniref:glutamate--tRNA ligase n=1 Tax=Poseidonibacter lekithochrous TaxID=1904463 RepID=UPI0008FC1F88|nr:glutamate--tRNA ligase [Poseidonibacter lekithochrous]QKJ23105.1 glutamyl-tRNA synthetase [Poseidonibacter lekithochrous]
MLRFAPSPTGDMNIGDLRVAILNYIVSKQLNEGLIVRIEDTDGEKIIEGKDKEILQILSLFSIDYERAVHQSDSLKYHQKMVMQLLAKKKAFSCFCGDAKLKELEEEAKANGKANKYDGFCATLSDETILNTNSPFTIRIKESKEDINFVDSIKGELNYSTSDMDSFIILNHDKTPTANYAAAVDDMILDISTVIRDEKHISNTANQIFIRKSLGYDKEISYAHLSSITNSDITVQSLIDDGFIPSAIANYLVLLGNETPSEIFTLEEAIEWFDIKNISKESVNFDMNKLKAINKIHLEKFDDMRLSKILGFADTDIGKLGKILLNESSTIKEIKSKIDLIFAPKITCEGFEKEFVELKLCIQDAPYLDNYMELEKYLIEKTGFKNENLLKPLKYILTGREDGAEISEIYPLIKNYLGEIAK